MNLNWEKGIRGEREAAGSVVNLIHLSSRLQISNQSIIRAFCLATGSSFYANLTFRCVFTSPKPVRKFIYEISALVRVFKSPENLSLTSPSNRFQVIALFRLAIARCYPVSSRVFLRFAYSFARLK
jgi:hypothetical protein